MGAECPPSEPRFRARLAPGLPSSLPGDVCGDADVAEDDSEKLRCAGAPAPWRRPLAIVDRPSGSVNFVSRLYASVDSLWPAVRGSGGVVGGRAEQLSGTARGKGTTRAEAAGFPPTDPTPPARPCTLAATAANGGWGANVPRLRVVCVCSGCARWVGDTGTAVVAQLTSCLHRAQGGERARVAHRGSPGGTARGPSRSRPSRGWWASCRASAVSASDRWLICTAGWARCAPGCRPAPSSGRDGSSPPWRPPPTARRSPSARRPPAARGPHKKGDAKTGLCQLPWRVRTAAANHRHRGVV